MVPYYFTALFFSVLATGVIYFMVHSRTGLALIAVREDETAASASGIHVLKYKVLAFAVGAFFTGICGGLYAYFLFHVHPLGFFGTNWLIFPTVMCMLGGAGTIAGPIVGVFFLTGMFELAKVWIPEGHPIFSGLLIIFVVLFLPKGLISLNLKGIFGRKRMAH